MHLYYIHMYLYFIILTIFNIKIIYKISKYGSQYDFRVDEAKFSTCLSFIFSSHCGSFATQSLPSFLITTDLS